MKKLFIYFYYILHYNTAVATPSSSIIEIKISSPGLFKVISGLTPTNPVIYIIYFLFIIIEHTFEQQKIDAE